MASFAEWTKKRKKTSNIEPSSQFNNSFATVGDIAPVRSQTSTQTTGESKWFQKSALFNNGWDKGDVSKTVKASGTDVAENAGAGFMGAGEKILDFLAFLGTAMNGQQMQTAAQNEMMFNAITGKDIDGKDTLEKYRSWQKEAEKGTEEFIKKDLYDEQAIAKKIITAPLEQKWGINVETDSVFGQKSDELAQSAGQLGATAIASMFGAGSAMIGATAFGGEMESALNQGATYNEAAFSSMVSAGAEILTEKISGGIKFGGKTLDETLTKRLTNSISNNVARKLVSLGMDAAGEGFEEVLSGTMSAIGQKLSYASDKELNELFSSEDAWNSFVGGAILGGLSSGGKNVKAKIKGVDSITGLTNNEQAVFDKVYNDRINEAKNGNKKLSSKDKSNIFNSVMNDLERGRIGIDTIESVLGGETYKQYQSAVEKDNQMKELQKEYDSLYQMKNGEKSDAQIDRQAELKQQLEDYKNNSKLTQLKDQLSKEVSELAKSGKLVESYNEKSRRSQTFVADLTQYDKKHQGTYKRAMESGILNNTNRTHEFVNLLAKLEADKGVLFDFTNNAKIKKTGFAIDGKQVNGYVQGNNISINIDSTSALNKVVGHEITHVLEGTELYTELANVVKEFAKTKGEYDSKLQSITKLYEGIEDANIENELTADLIGEYLFTDREFINKLSAEKPTLFQKIFDEIKYFYKTATAGSKEAKQLEKVKKTFEEAYRQKNNTATDDGVKYKLRKYSPKEISNWENSKRIVIYENDNQYSEFINTSLKDKKFDKKIYFGAIPKDLAEVVKKKTGIDVENYNCSISAYEIRKIIKDHGSDETELPRGQQAIKPTDFLNIPQVIQNSDNMSLSKDTYNGKPVINFSKNINGKLTVSAVVSDKHLDLFVQTAYKSNKKRDLATPTGEQAPVNTLEASNGTVSNSSVPQDKSTVNNNSMQKSEKNSLSDENQDIAPVGKNNVYGEDIKLQTASAEDIAPIGENVVRKTTETESDVKKQTTPEIDLFVKPNKPVEAEQDSTPKDTVPVEQSAETTETVEEKPKSKRLERAIRKIDTQLEQDKADLNEDFQQKKAELEKALENKTTYISDKSLSLYKELQNLRKGVRASNDLAYFLDLGYEWKDLKSTLLKVHKWPDTVLNTESEIELTVRESIGRDFDEKSYELDDLDTEYQKQLEDLEKKAEEKRKKAGVAEQRRVKVQEYRTQMDDLIGDTTTWKDKKLGIQYQINTLRRNLRDIVRDKSGKRDLAKADAIYDELQGRYNHNEAELNREANRIKKVYADMQINKVEDKYIQMLGEYRHNPDTKLTLEEMQEFLEKNRDKIDEAKVDRVIELARETYDSLFGRVNAVLKEQGMREIPYRLGYFPHFTEEKQGRLAKLLNWKTHKTDIPTDIAGLTEQFNPNRSWQSFNKQRTGDDTDYSFTKGLDTYVQGALDWIYHIEDIQKRRAFENHIRYVHSEKGIQEKIDAIHNSEEYDADEMQEQIDAVFKEAGNPLNNFVTDFRTQTNTLAGKKSSMDRNMEAMLSRDVYSTMTNISNRVTANMVVGSVSSALTNFIPITQSWGEVLPISSLRAMKDTIKSTIQDDGTIDKSDFLTNRLRKNENLYQTTWDKVIDKAGAMMEIIDSFTSQTVWRSKYLENISNGMSENESVKNADQFAENVLAGRSRGNNPTIFDSKNLLIKTLTAFQLEVNNQYGYMFKDMPQDLKNKSIGKLVKGYGTIFLGAYAYNALYSALAGRDAAFDPISIIEDLLKDLFGEDEEEPADIVMNLTDNILEEIPFVGGLIGGGRIPISSALPYDDGIYGAFEGVVTDATEGNWGHLAKEFRKSFVSYLLLPAGGGQIKKSIQGVSMFDDDFPIAGSYTDSGKLRFSVEETPGNIAQAAVFGQYASKTARQYFDEEHAPLSDKQAKELVDIQASMEEYWEYQKGLKKLGEDATLAEKIDYIADLEEFDTWQKNIMANNLTTRKDPIDLTGYEDIGNFEEYDYAMKNPEKYAISKAVGGYDNYIKYSEHLGNITAEKDKNGNSVSGSRKKKVARYINNLDIEFGEKMILYRSQYKSDDTYNAQIVEYLNSRNDIARQDKITILTELGFKVLSDGTVKW